MRLASASPWPDSSHLPWVRNSHQVCRTESGCLLSRASSDFVASLRISPSTNCSKASAAALALASGGSGTKPGSPPMSYGSCCASPLGAENPSNPYNTVRTPLESNHSAALSPLFWTPYPPGCVCMCLLRSFRAACTFAPAALASAFAVASAASASGRPGISTWRRVASLTKSLKPSVFLAS